MSRYILQKIVYNFETDSEHLNPGDVCDALFYIDRLAKEEKNIIKYVITNPFEPLYLRYIWCKNGTIHKDSSEGHAIFTKNASREWSIEGHELFQLTVTKEWIFEGKKHRVDGPAVETQYGYQWISKSERMPPMMKKKIQKEYWEYGIKQNV